MSAQKNLELVKNLLPRTRPVLKGILEKQNEVLWGKTEVVVRKRSFNKCRHVLYSVVKPHWLNVQLYSSVLKEKVPLTLTKNTLTHIEGMGGLDDYLLKTPEEEMKSNFSSNLRWRVVCEALRQGEAEAKAKNRI
mmetsp:Transcript_29023/g.53336  ORF Transcript_29023/g.53336 Transcript_29023/m.53336 type:complete len:135 (-) Transcript_29023:319-723(-)